MAKTTNSIDQLAGILLRSLRGAQQAASMSGQRQSTYGTIVDVADPNDEGRVRVILDQVNPDYLKGKGFEQAGKPTETDWIFPIVPFKGKQPQALVSKKARVPIVPRDGDPNRLNFGDPVFDPNEFEKAQQPQNSAMTRLPVYPAGQLPPAAKDNLGCMIVEEGGPQGYDWLCVCLNRGGYKWVRHIDRLHIHLTQVPDSDGDSEGRVNDDVEATT